MLPLSLKRPVSNPSTNPLFAISSDADGLATFARPLASRNTKVFAVAAPVAAFIFALSAALKEPASLSVAGVILTTGDVPGETIIGAVPVTSVTSPETDSTITATGVLLPSPRANSNTGETSPVKAGKLNDIGASVALKRPFTIKGILVNAFASVSNSNVNTSFDTTDFLGYPSSEPYSFVSCETSLIPSGAGVVEFPHCASKRT